MDSRILCVNLLLAGFCLWSIEAGGLEDSDSHYSHMAYPAVDSPDTRSAINAHATHVASRSANNYANKAKTSEAHYRLMMQCVKDRSYYFREYTRLAQKTKQRSMEMHQMTYAEGSRIGRHEAAQRDWESKGREALAQSQQADQARQEKLTKLEEAKRDVVIHQAKAAVSQAQAEDHQRMCDRLSGMAQELHAMASSYRSLVQAHLLKSKEDRNKATAHKVNAHQQAQDSQRHMSASQAYMAESVRTHLASRNNILKYIQNSLLAERHRCLSKLHEVKSDLSRKLANSEVTRSEQSGAIKRTLIRHAQQYRHGAKVESTKAYEYEESKNLMGTEMSDAGQLLYMAQAKEEKPDYEHDKHDAYYPADDPIDAMPSEDKYPMDSADEGMSA